MCFTKSLEPYKMTNLTNKIGGVQTASSESCRCWSMVYWSRPLRNSNCQLDAIGIYIYSIYESQFGTQVMAKSSPMFDMLF